LFSFQQLFGKHLLIILLTIALGGVISIAAVPQLRGPVTDYIGENFGPKADVVDQEITNLSVSNDFYTLKVFTKSILSPTQEKVQSQVIKVGDSLKIVFSVHIPTKEVTSLCDSKPTCKYILNQLGLSNFEKSISKCQSNQVTINLPTSFNKSDIELNNIKFSPDDLGSNNEKNYFFVLGTTGSFNTMAYSIDSESKQPNLSNYADDYSFNYVRFPNGLANGTTFTIEVKSFPGLRSSTGIISYNAVDPNGSGVGTITNVYNPTAGKEQGGIFKKDDPILDGCQTEPEAPYYRDVVINERGEINNGPGVLKTILVTPDTVKIISKYPDHIKCSETKPCSTGWQKAWGYGSIPITIDNTNLLNLRATSYLRFDKDSNNWVEHSLTNSNPDDAKRIIEDHNILYNTQFQPGDKINFESSYAKNVNNQSDQNNLIIESQLPFIAPDLKPNEKKFFLAYSEVKENIPSYFVFDEGYQKLIWNYNTSSGVDNRIKFAQYIVEKFQLQIPEKDLDLSLLEDNKIKVNTQLQDLKRYREILFSEVNRISQSSYQIVNPKVVSMLNNKVLVIKNNIVDENGTSLKDYINTDPDLLALAQNKKDTLYDDLIKSIKTVDQLYFNEIPKSNILELKIESGPKLSLCNKEYTECLPSQDTSKVVAEQKTFPGDIVYLKYTIPTVTIDQSNITANIYLPDESKFVPESNSKIKVISKDHLQWNIDKIEAGKDYSTRFSLKLDDSINLLIKKIEVKADHVINNIIAISNILKIDIWSQVNGTVTTPFENPLPYANMLVLDGDSTGNEDQDASIIVKGITYNSLIGVPEELKPIEDLYVRTNNKGKFEISFPRSSIKNDQNTIKLRLDYWDSRGAKEKTPILKFFYSNNQVAHFVTKSFDISAEKSDKKDKDINISDNEGINAQNFDYPDRDYLINKELMTLAEVYYNLYQAYIKISAENGDFNIQLDSKSVTVQYGFDEAIGDNGVPIDYGSYRIKDDKLVLNGNAIELTKDRKPYYEYHQLAHAMLEKVYNGKFNSPEVPIWIVPFKKPHDKISKPMGGYMNDYTTNSFLEGLANIISYELTNKIFPKNVQSYYIDNSGSKFNINDPIAIFDIINDNNESRAVTNLVYGLLHGVGSVSNASIEHLNISKGKNIYKISFPENSYSINQLITYLKKRLPTTVYDFRCDLIKIDKIGQDGSNEVGLNYLDRLFIRHGFFADLDGDWKYHPNKENVKIGWSINKEEFTATNGAVIGARNWRK